LPRTAVSISATPTKAYRPFGPKESHPEFNRDLTPSILDDGLKSSRSPLHTLRRNSKYELSRQFISCVVPLQNQISPTTIPPIGTGRTIRLFIPRNQCPTLQFRYCFCSCMELSFLQFAVGFVVNFKHSATIPRPRGFFTNYSLAPPTPNILRAIFRGSLLTPATRSHLDGFLPL